MGLQGQLKGGTETDQAIDAWRYSLATNPKLKSTFLNVLLLNLISIMVELS